MRKPMISLTESYLFFSRKKIKDAIMTLYEKDDLSKEDTQAIKELAEAIECLHSEHIKRFVVSKKITYVIRKTQDRR